MGLGATLLNHIPACRSEFSPSDNYMYLENKVLLQRIKVVLRRSKVQLGTSSSTHWSIRVEPVWSRPRTFDLEGFRELP